MVTFEIDNVYWSKEYQVELILEVKVLGLGIVAQWWGTDHQNLLNQKQNFIPEKEKNHHGAHKAHQL